MNAQVSFGSQPQYRPHAASAQIAPAITAKVQMGKAKACSRKVSRSSASAFGTRGPKLYGKLRLPCSYPARIRNIAPATNPTRKVPEARTAAVTCTFSQYEFSAGT